MMERYEELKQYLPGIQRDMPSAYEKLAEIFQQQVFELHVRTPDGKQLDCYIPYMMNDAVECYLILRDCQITGEYLEEESMHVRAQLACRGDLQALILKQAGGTVCTIWFKNIEEKFQCYQYHRIGHFWVKGQEQWRQLVYMAGTIYEKYEYLGKRACTKGEREVMKLVECAPFCYWSPIGESLEGRYPATEDGIDCMQKFAKEAGDRSYSRMLGLYRKFRWKWLEKRLAEALTNPKRQALYELIYEKIKSASRRYPKRNYGECFNETCQRERKKAHHRLKQAGFTGAYPEYERDNVRVTVTEEHPFTIMEADDFGFRLQYMVSRGRKKQQFGRNGGFFKGKGREGWIEQNLDFLKRIKENA